MRAFAQPNAARPSASETPRRLAIEGVQGSIADLKISDLEGRDLTDQLRPQREDGAVTVALARPLQFTLKPRAIATLPVPVSGERITLPGGIVVPLAASSEGSRARGSAWFRLTLAASPMPAPWDPDAAEYATRLTFGLRRPPQIPADVSLERPVIVKLGFQGLTAPELPPLTIEAAGLEHEKTVELRFQPRTPAPKLLVRSSISDVDLALAALARLNVRPQQHAMLGYGLETVAVLVENVEAHGALRALERETPVAIELTGGARLESVQPAFAAGAGSAVVHIRSSGIGPVTVSATADGLTGRAIVEQRFPTGPLIAAVLGGALGGYARRFVKGARRARARRQVIEGIVVGLVAFVAGVLGVGHLDFPSAIVATEAGAFLVCALSGFAGVSVIEFLAKKRGNAAA